MVGRLGIIADVHGNALALEAVLRHARQRGVERFVDLGDTVYGPLQPLESYRLFQDAGIIAGVAGNQDRRVHEASAYDRAGDRAANRVLAFVMEELGGEPVAWLKSLPATAIVDGEIFLCHGTPASDTTYLLEDVSSGGPVVRAEGEILELLGGVGEPVILCGHSHIPRIVKLMNGQMVVNPGSVGLPAYDDDTPVKHFMETYSPHASYAVLEKAVFENGAAGWEVALHRVAYDWNEAALQAKKIGANDWAVGIATGRMRGFENNGPRVAGTPSHSVTY